MRSRQSTFVSGLSELTDDSINLGLDYGASAADLGIPDCAVTKQTLGGGVTYFKMVECSSQNVPQV